MRITHVITRLIVGGAQENTIASVLGLRSRPEMEVHLVSGPTSGPEGSLESQVSTIPGLFTLLPNLVRPLHPWKDPLAWRGLVRFFRQQRPEIVHTHSGKAGILGRLAAHRARVPIIVHTIHGPSFGAFQGTLANVFFRAAERAAGSVTTHFITVAQAMTQQYLDAGIGSAGQFTRILSGFDIVPFLNASNDPARRARYGIGPTDFVVGKIARLFRLKGHDDLFAAAPEMVRRCPALRFLLIGNGEWRQRFEDRVRQLGLADHFIFAGLVPPSEVPALLGICDLVVHLSQREGLARVLPQALAAGKPVVAYDCDGAREVCLPNETGFLVPPGDLAALSRHVLELAQNPDLRDQLARRGRALVQEWFPVERMINELVRLYERLCSGSSRPATARAGG